MYVPPDEANQAMDVLTMNLGEQDVTVDQPQDEILSTAAVNPIFVE